MASKHGTVSKRRHFSHIFLCMRSEFTQTCVSFVSVPGAAGSWKRIHRVMVSWAWKSYDTLNWDSMSVRLSHTLKQICFEAINQWNRASVFITHVGLRGPRSTNSRSHTAKKLISWCALKALVYSRTKEMAESVLTSSSLFYRPSDSLKKRISLRSVWDMQYSYKFFQKFFLLHSSVFLWAWECTKLLIFVSFNDAFTTTLVKYLRMAR